MESHSLLSEPYTLDPECFVQLKTDGILVYKTRHCKDLVDVSSHVAAQNAYGWYRKDDVYVPYGTSHSALILNNVQFNIPASLFRPLHKSPLDETLKTPKEE